jgi:dipeptide/tripeptide permease
LKFDNCKGCSIGLCIPYPCFSGVVCLAVLAICVGSGSNSVILPFGGDQFSSAHKEKLSLFFSVSYFFVTVATLLAILVTPVLRHDYQCFAQDSCFPLVFAVLGLTCVASLGTCWIRMWQESVSRVFPNSPRNLQEILCSIMRKI